MRSCSPNLCRQVASPMRSGLTIVEMLVAISIIGVLTSLIAPAVLKARNASQRMECQNRLRNVAVGMQSFADANRRYPAAALFATTDGNDLQGNWVVQLLPYLDQPNVFKAWNFEAPASDPVNQAAGRMPLPVLTSPVDVTSRSGSASLSYVANGGIGWTEPVDCPVCLHTTS